MPKFCSIAQASIPIGKPKLKQIWKIAWEFSTQVQMKMAVQLNSGWYLCWIVAILEIGKKEKQKTN